MWLHGGAWLIGAGSDYNPADLSSRNNVIVVTINYRLGPFGYLALPGFAAEDPYHSTGNYGFQDQQAALRWVKANIAGFGGDPDNVTLMGHSAGAFSVCDHLASPLSKGLFQKAIVESGPCSSVVAAITGLDMRTRSNRFAARPALGCTGTAAAVGACMRSKSTEELLEADAGADAAAADLLSKVTFFPSVDGRYLPTTPRRAILTGRANKVPLLIGTTHDEGTLFGLVDNELAGRPLNASNYQATVTKLMAEFLPVGSGIVGRLLTAFYPLRDYPTPPGYDPFVAPAHLAFGAMLTDIVFSCSAKNTYGFTRARDGPPTPTSSTIPPRRTASRARPPH